MQWIAYEELINGEGWVKRRWVMGKWSGRRGLGKGSGGKRVKHESGKRYAQDNGHVWVVHLMDEESRHSVCGRSKMEVIEAGIVEQEQVNDTVTCMSCLQYAIELRNAVRVYEGQLFRAWDQG